MKLRLPDRANLRQAIDQLLVLTMAAYSLVRMRTSAEVLPVAR